MPRQTKQKRKINQLKITAMFDFLTAPLVIGIICAGIYGLFELFVRKNERLTLIEKLGDKLGSPAFDGRLSLPNYSGFKFSFSALKAGLLLVGIGLGLLFGFIFTMNTIPNYAYSDNWRMRDIAGIVYGASVLLGGGLGLVAAFLIELGITNKQKKGNNQ